MLCPLWPKNAKNHDHWICSTELYSADSGLIKSRRCIEISAASFAPARHVYCPASEHRGGVGVVFWGGRQQLFRDYRWLKTCTYYL